MWNKLFKSKSKSSKNLSTSSSSHSNGGGPSSSPPLDLVPIYNIDNRIRYGDDDFEPPADDVELRRNHNRDSIGPQMCGIPMRKSKFSSAFKSLSLRRGSTKNQLKLYPGEATPVDESPTSAEDIQISAKRASLRPSKSDNNLNEKQNYADQEKEDPVYEQQQQQYRPPDPFLEIPDPPEHLELQPCPICARNFVPTSLVKHIAICERMQSKKRKPFDSSRQRREGTELASYLPKNFGLPQNHPQARVSPPKTTNPVRKLSTSKTPTPERKDYSGGVSNNNTMSTSQTLATMSSSGGGSNTHQTTATGATTPRPILKRSLSQQNEPCPYCERCFGFKAYDRHVEWCREKALLNKNIQHHQSSVAKERLQARIQYKAPQLKSKRALNREKYSGSLSCGGSTSSLADLDLPFPRHRSHLNSMSSSLSSDNKSDHSGSLKKIPSNDPGAVGYAGDRRGGTLPGKKREIRANLLENENFRNDSNNNNSNPTGKIFGNNLLIRSTQDVRREKEQAVSVERVERLELVATGRAGEQRVPLKRGATKIVKCNKSGYTPDRYDPFLSAKRQLEELFSPTSSFNTSTKQQQQTSNSRVTSPVTPSPTQVMSKSVVVPATTKTTSPNMNLSNFRRASSLRMPRKVSRPMFIEKAKSNIQKGITDDGPVSPNFLKSSEYDEIPIKSVFNAAQMAEKPRMRDSSSVRRNLKLDIKDPNMPATDVPLSKTDSLAVFLKYEHELNLLMSEKEMKDKSNSLSKRSASLTGHERKETYSPSVNSKSNERSSPSEKEKPVQEIQPIKKVPQKLVPIKLDPINITYNNNNSNSTSKPTVISLDAILGKSSTKPKAPPPEEKLMTRKESTNYIDPKLINRCDNLPIMVTKLTKPELIETKPTVVATTIPKVSPEPPKRQNGTSPETEGGGGKAADNRLSDLSTKSDDSKLTLTRQNGTSASRSSESSSIGDSSREPSPPSQRSEHKPNQDAKSQSPDSGVERSTPTKQPASTPIAVQKPERPPLPSFDDFDFEEFISSFEDERRSFQNAFYSRNATSNNTNNNNSSTSSFNQRVTNNSFTDNSVKSAVNGSSTSNNNNNNTSSPSHFAASKPLNSSQSYYKPLNINGRSEEEETRQKSPQVPPRRHQPPPPPPEQPPSTIRNLPSIQPVVAKTLPGSPTPNNPNSIFSYGPPSNDTNNNNNSVKSSPSSTSRLGSGNNNSFNNSPLTATTHQPYQQQHTTLPKTPSATNHMISATPSPPPPPLANSAASTAFLDDLSPTERDLMKSVQELDRMCESSSSMYPADSDEVSSVEGYPLSGSRDGGGRGGQRPSEGSKFSADSAYGSLSRQSPNQQDSHHTHTVRRTHHHHHHRGGATSQQQQLLLQQDAFDNSSGSESSLPPITTATLKAQKIELHSHGSSTKLAAGPTATAAAAAMAASQMSKFCHECGSRFMISTAKFCMECGVRRIMLD